MEKNEIGKLSKKRDWEQRYSYYKDNRDFKALPMLDLIDRFSAKYKSKNFLEIGAVPGDFSAYFKKSHNCNITGLDYCKSDVFHNTMSRYGIDKYNFINADITKPFTRKRYDIVASFGFIEHFKNTDLIIQKHFDLLDKKGILIITVPNFNGLQLLFHRIFDEKNLKIHNTNKAVDKSYIESNLKNKGMKILLSEYSSETKLWVERPEGFFDYFLKGMGMILASLLNMIKFNSSKSISSYIIIIAEK